MSEKVPPEAKQSGLAGKQALAADRRQRIEEAAERAQERAKLKAASLEPQDAIKDPSRLWEDPPTTGDSAGVSARVSIATKTMIQQVVQSGIFPYRNESDLVRPAVTWFLRDHIMPFMDGRFERTLKYQEALRSSMVLQKRLNDLERLCDAVKNAVRVAIRHDLRKRAVEHVREILTELPEVGDREWQLQARKELKGDPAVKEIMEEIEGEEEAEAEA